MTCDQVRERNLRNAVLLSIGVILACSANVARGGCPGCGCQEPCQKICRLVKEEKKITTTCWGCRCEDFCVGGPSCPGCEHCDVVCGSDCDREDVCVQPKRWVWTQWIPGCSAEILTKKKLMKRVVTRKVASFKWVVEDRCAQCRDACELVEVPPDMPIPPVPAGDIHVVHNFHRRDAESSPR